MVKLVGASLIAERKNGHLYRICARWLAENFGYRGTITKVELLESNLTDMVFGIVRVRFEFRGPRGKIGDGMAFLDQEEVACASR